VSAEAAPEAKRHLGDARGQLAAWVVLGTLHAAVTAATAISAPRISWRAWAMASLYDMGQTAALGLAAGGAVLAWQRVGRRFGGSERVDRRIGGSQNIDGRLDGSNDGDGAPSGGARWKKAAPYAAIAVVSAALSAWWVVPNLGGVAGRLGVVVGERAALALLDLGAGAGMAAVAALGGGLSRRRLGWVGAAIAIAAAGANESVLRNDYPGAHLAIACAAATLLGTCLARARVARADVAAAAPRAFVLAAAALSLLAAWSLVTVPESAVARELFRRPGAVLAPVLAIARARADVAPAGIPPDPWYSEGGRADVPPGSPRLVGPDAIVILIVVDALRADAASGALGTRFPALAALERESVSFTRARSAASGTIWSLATLFSGRYFSQLRWTWRPGPARANSYPHEDQSPRFPEILAAAGADTVIVTEMPDMTGEHGVARGFTEERCAAPTDSPSSKAVISAAIARLGQQGSKPMLMYLHLLEPHAPYDSAGTFGSDLEGYLREVGIVDRAIRRLREAIAQAGLSNRVTLVLTADHGEAFGEHGTTQHAVSVYEELLRVPLWIAVPGVAPRAVDAEVSSIDLGPTLLDLLGCATPATFMGQSLVPFLRGESPALSRPIVADTGRWQQAMIFPDHLKIIRDRRRGTVELYDLDADPRETADLFATDPRAQERLDRLRAFFHVHAYRAPGYEMPYRP
jgi:arylsulfatase A-like enzyme